MARRGAGGWSSEQVGPPVDNRLIQFSGNSQQAFTPNLDQSVTEGAADHASQPTRLRRHGRPLLPAIRAAPSSLLSPGLPPDEGEELARVLWHEGIAADGSHEVFVSEYPLPGGRAHGLYLYDWSAATESLTLLPAANVGRSNGTFGAGTNYGNNPQPFDAFHVVSEDGSRIFLENGVFVDGATLQPVSGQFWIASLDGSVAYYTEGEELQRYDVAVDEKVDLTEGGEVTSVLGASDDGSRVYFVAKAALAPGATPGEENFYLWTDDGTQEGEVTFIVTAHNFSLDVQPHSRVSANGMHLAFNSTESLTAYPNEGHPEIYTYDAASGELSCASCNPSGEPATSGATTDRRASLKNPNSTAFRATSPTAARSSSTARKR